MTRDKKTRAGFHRLAVEFTFALLDHLDDISDQVGVTRAEILRRAVLLYGWAVEEAMQGRDIAAVDPKTGEQFSLYSGEPGLRLARLSANGRDGAKGQKHAPSNPRAGRRRSDS